MSITSLWHATLHAFQDWWNDNCLRLAASLAYYTALSLAPLVLLIVGDEPTGGYNRNHHRLGYTAHWRHRRLR